MAREKTYTQEDVDRMCELKQEIAKLVNNVAEITRGDSWAEDYFTNHLKLFIKRVNRFDQDFDSVIKHIEANLEEDSGDSNDES